MNYNFLKERTSADIDEDSSRVFVVMKDRDSGPMWFTMPEEDHTPANPYEVVH